MTFLILCTFNPSGHELLVSAQDPQGVAAPIAEEVGATVTQLFFTTGIYDAVVILEADTLRAALAFSVAFGQAAGATTLTLSAEGAPDGVSDVVDSAARAHTRIGMARSQARG